MRAGSHLFLSVFVTLWSQPINNVFASSPPPSPPSPSQSLGIIVGCTLGGIALAVIIAMLFLIRRVLQSQNTPSLSGRVPILDLDAPLVEDYRHDTTASRVLGQNVVHSTSSEQLGPATPSKATVSHPRPSPPATVTSAPVRGDFQALSHRAGSQDSRRTARQTEINERLQSAQQEMNNLTTAESARTTSSSRPPPEAQQEVASLRTQIHNLRNQIDHLQRRRQSNWALGLSDDEPPAYS